MTIVDPDLLDWRERRYVSQNATETVGLAINKDGAPVDADGDVTATLIRQRADGTTETVSTYTANHTGTGLYEVTLTGEATATQGDYAISWEYTLEGTPDTYVVYLVVGQSNPAYDKLPPEMKDVVDNVWMRFADLFDSPSGGPNLQTYFQTHWSRGRVAQLMGVALRRINIVAQPVMTYTLDPRDGTQFPLAQWGGLLETGTYIECLKHLIRSYVEQPQVMVSNVSRLDRRDYVDRWRDVLQDEQATYLGEQEAFKIRHMGFGSPRVLISGGVYGRYAPTRVAGFAAARPRFWARFFVATILTCSLSGAALHGVSHASPTLKHTSGPVSISRQALMPAGPGNFLS